MYDDLRKYIIHNNVIEKETSAWYFKNLCEHCKDQNYVQEIIRNLYTCRNDINFEELSPYDSLIYDWHLQDSFDIENLMINLIMKCFTLNYEISGEYMGAEDIFFNYTTRGRKLCGMKQVDDPLIDFFDTWQDLLDIFSIIPDDAKIGEDDDLYEKYELYLDDIQYLGMFIKVDQYDPYLSEISYFMEMLSFSKVTEGLYVYGCIDFSGCADGECLRKSDLNALIDLLDEKKTDLSEYDNVFALWNNSYNHILEALLGLKGRSDREVLF